MPLLDDLNLDLLDLADAWKAIPDKRRPPPLPAADARGAAARVHTDMNDAYANLESETDAFRVEADVKKAFEAADRAWKPPPPPKRKRK